MSIRTKAPLLSGLLILTILACSVNDINISAKPNYEMTITAQALAIQLTGQAPAQPAPASPQAPATAAVPTDTAAPTATATVQKPQVINSTLCWLGPGGKYEVMSSLSKGENVEVIGRGSISGWLILRNPRYHDPCWAQASDLQIDPSLDLNSLQVFTPPALPTNTPKPTPTPTP